MKTIKMFVLLLTMIAVGTTIGFVSCQKQQTENVVKKNTLLSQRNGNGTTDCIRIKGAFRWDGVFGAGSTENCRGGDCGKCPGICLIIQFSLLTQPLTQQEILLGYGTALITIENDTLYFRPQRTIDNGDGNVRIASNFNIGAEVANALGKQQVIIPQGIYNIDYTLNEPHGIVRFPIICQ